ncbi:hypothetical protein PISMIDRAFT_15699 [Pisolithus microcarpus 441]|uniref:Uncharacterized protein n=1 Tax=Pisolithus microcarpus 441 TaxID=765257 RepID=A0A0C9Z9N5_9AGAM|nr:hypothetical protein PISMIDRAFT_15699 [Pisolithus microcarpus 441]
MELNDMDANFCLQGILCHTLHTTSSSIVPTVIDYRLSGSPSTSSSDEQSLYILG